MNTTSTSGLHGNPGQANYGAAKAGIAALTVIAARELARYGVRVNAVSPAARTRMTDTLPSLAQLFAAPENPEVFDEWDPANASPLVAYLACRSCPVTGRVFFTQGGKVQLFEPWTLGEAIEKAGRWTVAELADAIPALVSSRRGRRSGRPFLDLEHVGEPGELEDVTHVRSRLADDDTAREPARAMAGQLYRERRAPGRVG